MKKYLSLCLMTLFLFALTAIAGAEATSGETIAETTASTVAAIAPAKIDSGDTAFMLLSAALVMLMTPGLALFYGGMVRTKNVLSTLMQSFFILGLISVQWVLFGYSLAFAPDVNHLIGNLEWLALSNVGLEANADYAATIPHQAFMIFQAMFAVITPALISGSLAERMRFPAFALFALIWSTLVYDPVAHWVWGNGGWLRDLGILDFAGGTVVHILSGVSGLVIALYLGKRKGYGSEVMLPHHLPMTVIGASLLWFGWFGFNAGSALGANALAANAFIVTHAAAAAATVSWVLTEWLRHGKPTILGAASGCVAGLVAITPAAGYVSAASALIIGALSGIICYLAVSSLKQKLGYDDALDAFGVHGIGGTWGALATGIFAAKEINPAGADGLLAGNPEQLLTQLIGVAVSYAFAAIASFAILKTMSLFMELRADAETEDAGLDIAEHGERGYVYQDLITGTPLALQLAAATQSKELSESELELGYK